ncbi:hypothetical protein CSC62_12090 [Pseudoxanthomonas jiangsuensis]|uniref:TIGR04255 family protein n=1 Tax=Pseudoxanthomonas jiangsuensis TaxID=619688 RepID=UPI0013912201|nr:TIGR04255 family protein [Pseudoxanthomonas jiangsuensis]KAF1694206.1 hypothetical protein CSC62_12090 [Pseudoxanthomonas jiangsuensis]
MGAKLANAPVFLTAAQVRHNPILAVDSYAAALQEQFRKIGFTDYKVRVQAGFEIDVSNPLVPVVKQQESRQHSYINRTGSACFVLENSRLFFQVSDYDIFDTFRDDFLKGLDLLHSTVTLDYVDSVSMRLLDAIVPDKGEELANYLAKELLGIGQVLEQPNWGVSHSASESVLQTPEHKIFVRTLARHGKLSVPPDLNIAGMNMMPRFSAIEGVHLILDTDCAFESRTDFDLPEISSRLRLLKDDLRTTFQAAVTTHALDRWS